MTPEELLQRLAPVRVPEAFARFGPQDALAAIALGLFAALLLCLALRGLTRARPRPADRARAGIAVLAALPPQARIAGLAALLRELGGEMPAGGRDALYDPAAAADPAPLEAAVLAQARRARR
ncbi:hypothetical protein [Poseidonocella sp. HB161398]|uniref:hypothetical protein n=1 Tax=Poseidonocella sp. HB161398 TaxID=2320855 RepID=UPI001107E282|nr:hypothetical protein [Poseidonocella sp. HB161398]